VRDEQERRHLCPALLVKLEARRLFGYSRKLRDVRVNERRANLIDFLVLRNGFSQFAFSDLVGLGFKLRGNAPTANTRMNSDAPGAAARCASDEHTNDAGRPGDIQPSTDTA